MENLYEGWRKRLLKISNLLCCGVFILNFSYADGNGWRQTFGGKRLDSARDLVISKNSDYVFTGTSTSFSQGDSDVYVVRLKPDGSKLWEKTYGGYGQDIAYSIIEDKENNFLLAGSSSSSGGAGKEDIYLLKINSSGSKIWSQFYGSSEADVAREIKSTADGGFIVTGFTTVSDSGFNAFLLKINAQGQKIWMQTYGGVMNDHGLSVKEIPGQGYILYGQTHSSGTKGDFYLVKTDLLGNKIWSKNFGSLGEDEGQYILNTADGGFIMVGDENASLSDSNNFDVNITACDADGVIKWQKRYGGNRKDVAKMIQSTSDGGFIVAAVTRSFGILEPDFWVLKLKANGDTLWTRKFGGIDHEHCYFAWETSDKGFIIGGHTDSFEKNNIDAYILKLDGEGKLPVDTTGPIATAIIEGSDLFIKIYPIPADDHINIEFNKNITEGTIVMMNISGQKVLMESFKNSESTVNKRLDVNGLAKGIYMLNIISEGRIINKKIIVL